MKLRELAQVAGDPCEALEGGFCPFIYQCPVQVSCVRSGQVAESSVECPVRVL